MARLAQYFFLNPFLTLTCAAAAVQMYVLQPTWRAIALVGCLGTLFYLILRANTPAIAHYFAADPIAWAGAVGAVAAGYVLWRATGFAKDSSLALTKRARYLAAIFLWILLIEAANGRFLKFTGNALSLTWDHRMALLDDIFGVAPAFTIGRFLQRNHFIWNLSFLSYNALLLAFVSLVSLQARHSFRRGTTTLAQFFLLGVLGGCLYFLIPVAGPGYVFHGLYPAVDPQLGVQQLAPAAFPPSPRNGMPSLHTAWVVLLFLSAWRESLVTRIIYALVMVGTILSALGTGEHWVLDSVVAMPMAVGVSMLDLETVQTRDGCLRIAFGLLGTLCWCLALRFAGEALYAVLPVVPALSVATVASFVALWLQWRQRQHHDSRS